MPRNQDLDGCMAGRSSKTSVLVTSTLIATASINQNQRSIVLTNRDAANPIYFNYDYLSTGATTANASLRAGESVKISARNNVWGISTGGTVVVEWYTEEDI